MKPLARIAGAPQARAGRAACPHLLLLFAGAVAVCLAGCLPQAPPEPVLLSSVAELPVRPLQSVELEIPESTAPVLIEIRGAAASLDSRVVGQADGPFSRVHFEYLRSAPAWHVVDAAPGAHRPKLRIVPVRAQRNATLSVAFYALPADTRPGQALAAAWRDLARGQQHVATLDEGAWSENLAHLDSARRRFAQLGLERHALWAAYLHAYVSYFPLYRYAEAAAGAHAVLDAVDAIEAGDAGPNAPASPATLQVLAHQLAGQILLESDAAGDHDPGRSRLEAAREHFGAARDAAAAAGLSFEETWAINNLGIANYYADELERALDFYGQALARAEGAGDSYLVALIGSNVAVAQERRGRIDQAVQTLERIQQEPAMRDNPLEREHLLGLLGNFYLKLYRFPDALEALNEALRLSEALASGETRGRNRVMLGRTYREMGQPDKARALAQAAVPDLIAVQDRRGLRQARRLLADVHRLAGRFDAMQTERTREGDWVETGRDRAEWLFSRGEDAAARGDAAEAMAQFRASAAAFGKAGLTAWSDLALLNACAVAAAPVPAPDCLIANLRPALDEIRKIQASDLALRAGFAWARLLANQGHLEEALEQAGGLVEEIHFYRQSLPGVLGAWYWDARQEMFAFYVGLHLDRAGAGPEGRADALLALDRLRNATAAQSTAGGDSAAGATGADDGLRALLAQRDRATSGEERLQAQRLIDRELARRPPADGVAAELTSAEFLARLAELPSDWSLVVYYLAGPTAQAWLGDREGLRLFDLGPAAPILQRIDRVRSGLRVYNAPALEADLEALGEALLQPLAAALRFRLMVAGGGALSDLPLEALPVDGRPLIENRLLLHVQSARNAPDSARNAARPLAPRRLFLAGDPGTAAAGLEALPGARRELQAIRAAFPGAQATVHTQQSLTAAAFRGAEFRSADLVHLASHALIDREYPELSRLFLSGDATNFLTPADFEGISLDARLVVLSACETVGLNRFDFDNRLGFVSPLLRQSDGLVIASLWPVSDRATSELMAVFYRELAVRGDIPASLRAAKLRQRESGAAGNRAWAAFQLFSP